MRQGAKMRPRHERRTNEHEQNDKFTRKCQKERKQKYDSFHNHFLPPTFDHGERLKMAL